MTRTPEHYIRRQRYIGIALIVWALFTTGWMYVQDQQREDDRQADDLARESQRTCTIAILSDFLDTVTAGRAANATEQAGDRHLILSVLNGEITDEATLAAAKDTYRENLQAARAQRATAPIPPDPKKVC